MRNLLAFDKQYLTPSVARVCGFSLIELLVAMAIGLLGSLAIMQLYMGSEAGKRTAGSLSESQNSGLIALYAIERDLQQAGLGFMNLSSLGCNVRSNGSFNNVPLQPVSIVPAGATATSANNLWGIPPGDADSDMVALAYGAASSMVEGALVSVAAVAGANSFRLSNIYGINPNGDYMLVAESGQDCTLTKVTGTDATSSQITVDYGGAVGYSVSAYAMHLGPTPQALVYAVRNGALTRCDFLANDCSDGGRVNDTTVWVPIANDIVALVAQYGVDTSAPTDLVADTYCKTRLTASATCPSPDSGATAPGNMSLTQPARACDWARIPVVQIALVSRSGQYEKTEVSPATLTLWPDSAVAPTTTGPVWTVPDRHYRYRVTRSAVALRNPIWMGVQSSC